MHQANTVSSLGRTLALAQHSNNIFYIRYSQIIIMCSAPVPNAKMGGLGGREGGGGGGGNM